MTLLDLHARISQFVKEYGGTPPGTDDPRSFDMLSDFMLVINAELDFKVQQKPLTE